MRGIRYRGSWVGRVRALVTPALLAGVLCLWQGPTAVVPDATALPPPNGTAAADALTTGVTVTGADDLWHNHDVTLTFSPEPVSPVIAAIDIRVDGGKVEEYPGSGCQLVVTAPGDHTGDGEHVVEYRGRDADGNVGDWQSVIVRIDTRPPKGALLHAVGVMRTTTAKIGYRVNDAAPGAGAADVSISIRNTNGRVVQRLELRARATGRPLEATFSCRLPRGFYRIRMTARDLAGNAAPKAAETRLVVTGWMNLYRFDVPIVPYSKLPYSLGRPIPLVDNAPHDKQGVRMYRTPSGQLRDYPGGQARYGLANLNSYRLTGDAAYLVRATAQATRLLNTRVSVGKGWFYPNQYTRYRHAKSGTAAELMVRPWYSGMGQGQILSFMVRMYETTGEVRYLTAARYTLNGFLRLGPRNAPWVANLDERKQFWIQEWPKASLDYTFNGFMIASFGLYDYYRVTRDSLALLLFRAAASAALDGAPRFRRPGRPSVYCLLHGLPNEKYHFVHITCLKRLSTLTGDKRFSRMAARFIRDYPGADDVASAARAVNAVTAGTDLTAEDLQYAP